METLFADRPAKPPKTWRFWLFVLSPVLILGMCSVFVMKAKRALSKIQPAIEAFHERIESEQYAAIYAAAPALQRATPLSTLENYLGGIRKKTGACQPPPKYGSYLANANSNTEGTTIQVLETPLLVTDYDGLLSSCLEWARTSIRTTRRCARDYAARG